MRRAGHVHLVKANLAGAFAAQVFKAQTTAPQVALCQAGQAVGLVHFQHIALQHGVVHVALHFDAVVGKHVAVVLHMLAQLMGLRVFQPGFEQCQYLVAVQLVGRSGITVRQGNVGRLTGLHTQADAHNLGLHFVERGGLGVQGHEVRCLRQCQPAIECLARDDGFIFCGALRRCITKQAGLANRRWGRLREHVCALGGITCGRSLGQMRRRRAGQAFEAHALIEIVQTSRLFGPGAKFVKGWQPRQPSLQIAVGFDGEQLPRSGQPFQGLAQVVTHHAFDILGMGHHCLQAAVFLQPLDRGLGAHFGHTRHVVHRVAHQVLVVQHQVGGHAELFQHPCHIPTLAVHGVDDGDAFVDQLRQVFVAAADHHLHAPRGGQHRQGADDVVGLHARHVQHPHTQQMHHLMDGRNLQTQIVGHGRALRFVLGVDGVAKRGALGVEHAGHIGGRHLFFERLHHVNHAAHRTGGTAAGVSRHRPKVGHGMERAVQIA